MKINDLLQISPTTIDIEKDNDPEEFSALLVAEDYGQSIAMPHFGYRRPSRDYFNSNLMMHLFVIANISTGVNKVYLYDERLMGKDRDALCSLRLNFHLSHMKHLRDNGLDLPEAFISIRDNCVGQNKSHITMQFDCFLSLSFYKRVLLIYLIPDHSHMVADRVVAWVKQSLKGKNIYIPDDIVKSINKVENVSPQFLSHGNNNQHCFTGFQTVLGKYMNKMPHGFTGNYLFEFYEGKVEIKHLFNTSEEETIIHTLCPNYKLSSKAIWKEIFGQKVFDVTINECPSSKTTTKNHHQIKTNLPRKKV